MKQKNKDYINLILISVFVVRDNFKIIICSEFKYSSISI